MLSEIIDADFQEIENTTEVEEEAAPAPPVEGPSFEPTPPIEEKPEKPSKLDQLADFIGAYAAAIILTFIAVSVQGRVISLFSSLFSIGVFSSGLILRCWAGIWSLMLVKGALNNKTL